jgi:Flp pilus assembly pilin Flp
MLEKIRMFPLMAYLAFTGFVDDLKKDERGLSGVVVAVLLILVAVLAVILIWQFLGDAIATWWEQIINKSTELQ